MAKHILSKILFSTLFISTVLVSCRYDPDKFLKPKLTHESVLPVAHGRVTPLDNLEKQDTNIKKNPDGSFRLLFDQEISNIAFDSLVKIPPFNLNYANKLKSVVVNNLSQQVQISLGTLLQNADPSIRDSIYAHNANLYPFPPIDLDKNQIAPQSITIQDIKIINLEDGAATFTFTNNFPVAISPYHIEMYNQDNNELIADIVKYMPPNSQGDTTISFANKSIHQTILVYSSATIPGSTGNPVLIDTGATVELKILMNNLKASSGIAKISNIDGNKITSTQNFTVDVGDSIRLKELLFKRGFLALTEESFLRGGLDVNMELLSIYNESGTLKVNFTVPGSDGFTPGVGSKEVDLTPYTFTLLKDSVGIPNILPVTVSGQYAVDEDGYSEFNTLTDSVNANIKIDSIQFKKVTGFFGLISKDITQSTNIIDSTQDFLHYLKGAKIAFDSVDFTLQLRSTLGVSAKADLVLKSVNAIDNTTVILSDSKTLEKATENPSKTGPVETITNISLDKSKMAELISNIPKRIESNVHVLVNDGVPISDDANFLYDVSSLKGSLHVEAPFSLSISNLIADTSVTIDKALTIPALADDIEGGEFILLLENQFPVSLNISLTLLDSVKGKLQDLVLVPQTIPAAEPEGERVKKAVYQKISIPFDQPLIQNLKKLKTIQFKATVNTSSSTKGVKFYSDYFLSFKLVADNVKLRLKK